MTLPIERARSRRPVTWLTLVGILLLPALLGGILVAALQNPTERLDGMTAAIVNLDEPVTIDDQYTPLGRQLTAGLVEGSDDLDSNLTWVISNEEDAEQGLADGTYQAVITIPENFSAAATSAGTALSDGGEPEQATISITTPDDGLVADDLITAQVASAATSAMGEMLSEATTENILVGFGTIGEQLGEAADGAAQLADGAKDAADGATALPDGASQLADGASQLGSGAYALGDGASQLAGGAGALVGGAQQLSGGAGQLASGLDLIAQKAREAAAGASQLGQGLTGGADQMTDPAGDLMQLVGVAQTVAAEAAHAASRSADAAGQIGALAAECADSGASEDFCARLGAAAGVAGEAATAAGTASGYAAPLADGVGALPDSLSAQLREAGAAAAQLGGGLDQLAAGVDTSAAGARALVSGADQLGAGAGALGSGANDLATGADQLGAGASDLGSGATQLAEGAGTLVDGLGELATGSGDLAEGLDTATTSLPSFDDGEAKTLASVIANPVASDAEAGSIFGPTAIPLLAAVVLWFGGLASFLVLRTHTARTLTSRRSSFSLALRGLWPAAALGAGQGVLVALIVQFVADYDAAAWWSFAGAAVVIGIAFAAVNQALVAIFGGIGRWVAALAGVLAVATGLISTVPGWLAAIGAALPTAPAFSALIGGNGAAIVAVLVWGVLSLIATTLAVAMRRTTSAKAVLAAA